MLQLLSLQVALWKVCIYICKPRKFSSSTCCSHKINGVSKFIISANPRPAAVDKRVIQYLVSVHGSMYEHGSWLPIQKIQGCSGLYMVVHGCMVVNIYMVSTRLYAVTVKLDYKVVTSL